MHKLILWVDDEIDLLKPHIIYLEKYGYNVIGVSSPQDGLKLIQEKNFDLIFVDYNMPGIDGITFYEEVRTYNHITPIILITKEQDASIINKAYSLNISDFISKPINPMQLLAICKKYLIENNSYADELMTHYLKEFGNIEYEVDFFEYQDWISLYNKIILWDKRLANNGDLNFKTLHARKKEFLNERFFQFINKNYVSWIQEEIDDYPLLSPDIITTYLIPYLENNEKVFFLLLDCLRLDQWLIILEELKTNYSIKTEYYYSILPTSTPFSRNAIFSGMFPDEVFRRHPEIWDYENEENMGMNTFEEELFNLQLKRFGFHNLDYAFLKVYNNEYYNNLLKIINNHLDKKLIVSVITFLDQLSHKIANESLLMDLINNQEYGYINLTKIWFEQSPLKEIIDLLIKNNFKIIVTTDHGAVWGKKPLKVQGGRNISHSLRYKHGNVIYTDEKKALLITNPQEYRLPYYENDTKYALCSGYYYFVYPNNYNTYKNYFKNKMFHGGISMEEMILPITIIS